MYLRIAIRRIVDDSPGCASRRAVTLHPPNIDFSGIRISPDAWPSAVLGRRSRVETRRADSRLVARSGKHVYGKPWRFSSSITLDGSAVLRNGCERERPNDLVRHAVASLTVLAFCFQE